MGLQYYFFSGFEFLLCFLLLLPCLGFLLRIYFLLRLPLLMSVVLSLLGLRTFSSALSFFLICLFFVLFDLEILYLFPSIIASGVLVPFVLVLLLGTVIEYAFGTLDWIY